MHSSCCTSEISKLTGVVKDEGKDMHHDAVPIKRTCCLILSSAFLSGPCKSNALMLCASSKAWLGISQAALPCFIPGQPLCPAFAAMESPCPYLLLLPKLQTSIHRRRDDEVRGSDLSGWEHRAREQNVAFSGKRFVICIKAVLLEQGRGAVAFA
eukprot:1137655-Pelagomonas_calceolata.AAC.3